jgi:tRNA threonylcarbamoyladenosine biosynthesis protein TsaE
MKKRVISRSLEETADFAKEVAGLLTPGTVLLLFGEMGAGKTTFAKTIISLLTGIDDATITSPTFTYMNLYSTKERNIVCHFDLYRLKNSTDFLQAGFEEYLSHPYITLIEWPERMEELLKPSYNKISISLLEDESRLFLCS